MLICVIVPIYMAEKFLPKCIDSICGQTYKDIEIILVDDGSPDRCGEICDSYAAKDSRIHVLHTENQGHYLARNLAIQKARELGSKYIGFVDADDWIENDMFETMLQIAEKNNADIVECGYYWDYPVDPGIRRRADRVMNSTEALSALLKNELDDYLWDKLWRITCFDTILFPEGRSFKDAATTYKLFAAADKIVSSSKVLYHYQQVRGSIVHTYGIGRINQWLSNIEKYNFAKTYMKGKVDEADFERIMSRQVRNCAIAIAENWGSWYGFSKEDQLKYAAVLDEMHSFSLKHFPLFGYKEWPKFTRTICFFCHFKNKASLFCAYQLSIHRRKHKHTI